MEMKNLFVIFLSLIALAGISVGFVSCNNNDVEEYNVQEVQNELFLQMQDRFEEAGVVDMIDNYVLKNEDVRAINEVSTILKDLSNPKRAALRVDYADGAIVYSFAMPDKNMSVIKISQGEPSRNFICGTKKIQEEDYIFVDEKGVESLYAVASIRMVANHDDSGTSFWKGDCDQLGGRRPGELYMDCVQRNWNNFCCDLVGCLAQGLTPEWVAFAIAITCICPTN